MGFVFWFYIFKLLLTGWFIFIFYNFEIIYYLFRYVVPTCNLDVRISSSSLGSSLLPHQYQQGPRPLPLLSLLPPSPCCRVPQEYIYIKSCLFVGFSDHNCGTVLPQILIGKLGRATEMFLAWFWNSN